MTRRSLSQIQPPPGLSTTLLPPPGLSAIFPPPGLSVAIPAPGPPSGGDSPTISSAAILEHADEATQKAAARNLPTTICPSCRKLELHPTIMCNPLTGEETHYLHESTFTIQRELHAKYHTSRIDRDRATFMHILGDINPRVILPPSRPGQTLQHANFTQLAVYHDVLKEARPWRFARDGPWADFLIKLIKHDATKSFTDEGELGVLKRLKPYGLSEGRQLIPGDWDKLIDEGIRGTLLALGGELPHDQARSGVDLEV